MNNYSTVLSGENIHIVFTKYKKYEHPFETYDVVYSNILTGNVGDSSQIDYDPNNTNPDTETGYPRIV